MKSYEELLDNIYEKLPKGVVETERFEMPKFQMFTEGNKTIIRNFYQVVEKIRRDKNLLIKFLSKELAVPIVDDGSRVILQRRIMPEIANKKLEEFIKRYVLCHECHRPDTRLEDLGHGLKKVVCEACGASRVVR